MSPPKFDPTGAAPPPEADVSEAPEDVEADCQHVMDALRAGRPVDPEVGRRVRVRSKRSQERSFREHGFTNIVVDLIREVRGPL